MDVQVSKIEVLKKSHPDEEITKDEIFFIDAETLVTRGCLAKYRNVTIQTIKDWEKKGLERSSYSNTSFVLYNLRSFEKWYLRNIDTKYLSDKNNQDSDDDYSYDEDEEYNESVPVTFSNAKDVQAVEKALKERELRQQEELKTKKLIGNSIDIDKVDEQNENFISILLQTLKEKLISLPPKTEKKTKGELGKIYDTEFSDLVSRLKKALLKATRDNKKDAK